MHALGRHLLLELFDCDPDAINSLDIVKSSMVEAAKRAHATIVDVVFHEFNPFGISGVVVIAESHLAIHTWPEYRYAAVDVFSCGETLQPKVAVPVGLALAWLGYALFSERREQALQPVPDMASSNSTKSEPTKVA